MMPTTEKDARREPPEGWHVFGTHVDVPVRLEFSEETDDALMPLWERPIPPEQGEAS